MLFSNKSIEISHIPDFRPTLVPEE